MGHVINPISTRLGLNVFWNSNWSLNNKYNYNIMSKNNIFFFKFLNWILNFKKFKKKNIIFTHYIIYINNLNKIFINVYFYWPSLDNRFDKRKKVVKWKYSNLRNKKLQFNKNKLTIVYKKLYNFLIKYMFSHLYWYFITKYWNIYLSNKNKIKYYFILQNVNFANINVGTISTYICKRLIKQYSLNFTMKPILRDLYIRLKQKKIQGYRILCAGRFTRRQIAEKNWYKQGPVTNNNFASFISYQQSKVRLKYGICGIKIWINYGIHEKSSFLQSYNLIFPSYKVLKYILGFNNGINLSLRNTSWSLLLLRWKNNKITFKYYDSFIKNKILLLIYNKFIFNILKEFNYLMKIKEFKNHLYIIKNIIFYWPLLNIQYNSKILKFNLNLKNTTNYVKKKKILFIYE